ncbi:MAG: MerR family transcriptional regulator [Acidobacteria bacterium]|nr:MerR family transcriptional regulator [Acidobacteriota bacterium]
MSTASNQQSGISIGSLARRTGVPVDTLRAWERRYGVLRPERTDGGQRRYGDRDVERVLWLSARVAEGQRISDAVAALNALEREDDEADAAGGPTAALASRLIVAARQGDGARVELELDRAFAALPMVQAMELGVFPALADLGRRWAEGERVVVAEHLLSAATERRLAARLSAARRPRGPIGIVACPSGERHAVGALCLSVLMAQDGWRVSFLGADTPLVEADAVAQARRARACVAVCTLPGSAKAAAAEISELPNARMWVLAGPDAPDPEAHQMPVWGPSLEEARASASLRAAQD